MTLRTGVLLLLAHVPERLIHLAQQIEALGYDYLWLADERFFREVYSSLTLCAVNTRRIQLGPCVTDPYTRHPALTAMALATLDEISGGRALLGIGAGVSGFRELGIGRERPATAIREAVELFDKLVAGETADYRGATVAFLGGKLDFPPRRTHIPTYVASQRPAGLRAAGAVADGAIMQGCVAEALLAFFRKAVYEGARSTGRDPQAIDLVARVNVCIADDPQAAKDVMKPTIARSLSAQRPDFFTFARAGLTVPPPLQEKVLALPYTHDPAPLQAVATDIPNDFVDAVTLAGRVEEVAEGVVRLARSGITQLLIYPLAVDGRIEATIERFQVEVMPRVRDTLGG